MPEASDVATGCSTHSNAVFVYDLKIAQCRGLKCCQICGFAMILYNTMPTEALVKVMEIKSDDSETEILFDKRLPQVTSVTRSYSPVQRDVESGRRDPMRSNVEKARRNPLLDKSEQVQSSHTDF